MRSIVIVNINDGNRQQLLKTLDRLFGLNELMIPFRRLNEFRSFKLEFNEVVFTVENSSWSSDSGEYFRNKILNCRFMEVDEFLHEFSIHEDDVDEEVEKMEFL